MAVQLAGKWFLIYSNFPKWNDKTITNVSFNYGALNAHGERLISDQVIFYQQGKEKQYNGFDTVLNEAGTTFNWRGKGWLQLFTSKWKEKKNVFLS